MLQLKYLNRFSRRGQICFYSIRLDMQMTIKNYYNYKINIPKGKYMTELLFSILSLKQMTFEMLPLNLTRLG